MGDNPSDFNLAIDNFFDLFAKDLCPEVHEHEHEHEQDDKQNPSYRITPKVMKNDIRRYYSRMFMNTVNSGEFNQLQGFFSTFMMGPANFTVNHDDFDPSFGIPPFLAGTGPKLMVHFHLGMFVMFPDTIIRMISSQIVTSNAWSGTKIEIFVDVSCTKIHALSDDEWIPQLDVLEAKCSQLAEEKRQRLKEEELAAAAAAAASADPLSSAQNEDRPGIYDSFPPFESTSLFITDFAADSGSHISSIDETSGGEVGFDDVLLEKEACTDTGDTSDMLADTSTDDPNEPAMRPARKRRRRSRRSVAPETKTDQGNKTNTQDQENSENSNFISEEYIRMLCSQATLLPRPIRLRMDGTITLFLDENNHIQHLNIRARPKTE
uniref:Uncharacterized protein n=1 Tax=Spumella elongata TaxID=89044 RepID=A0A7S3HKT4_9STRA|mmetsp:Transcript_57404/g.100897  ORF Transcript_57404/g.100897 Transcript_57404/m.100897 type:complete len:379 (+) Transcript_57404:61-1197(+)